MNDYKKLLPVKHKLTLDTMIRKNFLILLLSVILLSSGYGQQESTQNSFSLQQAIDYAMQHNFDLRNAKTDLKIARKKVVETRAIGLPHINASAGYDYFVDIPTQLIPDFISPAMIQVNRQVFGLQPIVPVPEEPRMLEMRFGQPHNMSAGITASQLLFNGSYLVGLQAAKSYVNLSQALLEKKEVEVRHDVAKAYYPVLILQKNIVLLDSTLISLQKMLSETTALYEQGFVEDTDVDQINILINDIDITKQKMEMTAEIAAKSLKFLMGLPLDAPLNLTEKLDDLVETLGGSGLQKERMNIASNKDFRLLQAQKALAELDLKNKKAALLPVFSAYYNYQEKAMRDEFDFLDSNGNWFPSQVAGVKLNIPIFQSWQSRAAIQQKKLALEKVKVQETQLQEALQLKYQNSQATLAYQYKALLNKQMKMKQARRVYQKTKTKYKEGVESSFQLTQTFNQYLQSEMEYLNAILALLNAKEDIEMQLGK